MSFDADGDGDEDLAAVWDAQVLSANRLVAIATQGPNGFVLGPAVAFSSAALDPSLPEPTMAGD